MKIIPLLSATLFGTAATIALVQPYAVALSPEQVATIARQVTVQIDGQNPGSGVIVAREGQTYTVLTAAHVVPSPDEYDVVTPDGQKHRIDYKLVRKLPGVDLALVPFSSPKSYQVVTIGSSSQVRTGTLAYVSGFPASRSGDGKTDYRFALGQIEAHASRPLANGYALAYFNDTFSGMSGGPVLDQEGKLIGIHGASKTQFADTQGISPLTSRKHGLNLGIPIDIFVRLASQTTTNLRLPTVPPLEVPQTLTAEDFFIQAVDLIIAGNYKSALTAFEQVIRLKPSYTAAFIQMGNIRLNSGDYQGAIANFTEGIRLDPKDVDAFNNRGLARAALEDYQGAIADYTEAIRLNPKSAMAFYNRGISVALTGNFQGAIADYTEAIRLNPKNAEIYNNRGFVRNFIGDRRGAIADYTEAIRLNPTYARAYNNRGRVREVMGDLQAAIADYRKAVTLAQQQSNQVVYQDAVQNLNKLGASLR
jgi:Flp pilus assembly protein TadD